MLMHRLPTKARRAIAALLIAFITALVLPEICVAASSWEFIGPAPITGDRPTSVDISSVRPSVLPDE